MLFIIKCRIFDNIILKNHLLFPSKRFSTDQFQLADPVIIYMFISDQNISDTPDQDFIDNNHGPQEVDII